MLDELLGRAQLAAAKAPGFRVNRKSILGDLASFTRGTVSDVQLDIKLERMDTDLLRSTGLITITQEGAIVSNREGSNDSNQTRCEPSRTMYFMIFARLLRKLSRLEMPPC